MPPPGDLPNPGIEPGSPALQADSLPSEPPGNLTYYIVLYYPTLVLLYFPGELNFYHYIMSLFVS